MNAGCEAVASWTRRMSGGWNRFWFTAADPATLSIVRVFAGMMLLYTHLVWTLELDAFFGPNAWVSAELISERWQDYDWSHFLWIDSPAVMWITHVVAICVFAMLTVGWYSRVAAVLAYLFTISYIDRVQYALFGLDQINVMLAMYLMLGPCGARYSFDRWLTKRRSGPSTVSPSLAANVSIRLMQIHMCVIYFFSGTRKLEGSTWWDGQALWLSLANFEYQSIDMTWMADWPITIAFFTHLTIFFEISYAALIWPRLTRPVMLLLAVWLHLGIAICMGMTTFGLVMLIGNLAFVPPGLVRSLIRRRKECSPVSSESAKQQ
ncbi:MAG: HTTM domain-containing protein [Pirellulales bacterium]